MRRCRKEGQWAARAQASQRRYEVRELARLQPSLAMPTAHVYRSAALMARWALRFEERGDGTDAIIANHIIELASWRARCRSPVRLRPRQAPRDRWTFKSIPVLLRGPCRRAQATSSDLASTSGAGVIAPAATRF